MAAAVEHHVQAWALPENMHAQNWHSITHNAACQHNSLINLFIHSFIPVSESQSWLLSCGWPYLGSQYSSRSCTLMWSNSDWTSLWQSVQIWPGPNILALNLTEQKLVRSPIINDLSCLSQPAECLVPQFGQDGRSKPPLKSETGMLTVTQTQQRRSN